MVNLYLEYRLCLWYYTFRDTLQNRPVTNWLQKEWRSNNMKKIKKIAYNVWDWIVNDLFCVTPEELIGGICMVLLGIMAIAVLVLAIIGYTCDSTVALSTATTVFNCTRAIHF
jgi:hypothetical protein